MFFHVYLDRSDKIEVGSGTVGLKEVEVGLKDSCNPIYHCTSSFAGHPRCFKTLNCYLLKYSLFLQRLLAITVREGGT